MGRLGRSMSPVTARRVSALFLGSCLVYGGIASLSTVQRSVGAIGGSCGSGGPYVAARPCPPGTGWMILHFLFGGILGVAALIYAGQMRSGPKPLIFTWSTLFGWLGWNFIDMSLADNSGAAGTGFIVSGVVFFVMALAPLSVLCMSEARRRVLWGSAPADLVRTRARLFLWVVAIAGIVSGVAWSGWVWHVVR